jgi:hypothetical protein
MSLLMFVALAATLLQDKPVCSRRYNPVGMVSAKPPDWSLTQIVSTRPPRCRRLFTIGLEFNIVISPDPLFVIACLVLLFLRLAVFLANLFDFDFKFLSSRYTLTAISIAITANVPGKCVTN